MLKASGTIKEMLTNSPIDMILYDSELAKDIELLKNLVPCVQSGCKIQSIGKYSFSTQGSHSNNTLPNFKA